MYVIAGLGNPGKKYEGTRHNIGFIALDYMESKYGIKINKIKHKALIGEGTIAGEKVVLVKPQTFMNLSGESIQSVCAFYKIPPENVIVLHDDVSLDCGKVRIRQKGSDGGHNGLKSIICQLSSDEFIRIKLGVGGAPEHYDLADWVLGKFSKEEITHMSKAVDAMVDDAIPQILRDGVDAAMNSFNGKVY